MAMTRFRAEDVIKVVDALSRMERMHQRIELLDCKDAACYISQQSNVLEYPEREFAAYSALVRLALNCVPLPESPRHQEDYWNHFISIETLARTLIKYKPPPVPATLK